jgi:ferric-dicitrate binding protein FerR (iron transport regulator)
MSVSREYYKELSVEELLQDEFFIRSMQKPDEDTAGFWNEFTQQYPEQRDKVEAARSFLQSLKFRQKQAPEGMRQAVWSAIAAEWDTKPVVSISRRRAWKWVAASVSAIAIIALAVLFRPQEKKTLISSAYGEVKELVLPDQSTVTLNANSTLEYNPNWESGKPREVWLKGEGYFDVNHLHKAGEPLKESERFIVHTGGLRIEVLGTRFNASDRQSITSVVLEEGSVKVDIGDSSLLMLPGEIVEYDRELKKISRDSVNVQKAVSWKRKELMLDHTTVEEVIKAIEEIFGYKVEIENENLLKRQITGTGTISMKDEQTLFKALEVILQVDIRKDGTILHIKSR